MIFQLSCLGSVHHSRRDLKKDYGGKYEFSANENYKDVFRTIFAQSKKCHQQSDFFGTSLAEGELYPDIKSAYVTLSYLGWSGQRALLIFDIIPINDNSTKVESYWGAWMNRERLAHLAEKWVKEKYEECD